MRPGVAHWAATGRWEPLDNFVLGAMMVLIREVINSVWPLPEESGTSWRRDAEAEIAEADG